MEFISLAKENVLRSFKSNKGYHARGLLPKAELSKFDELALQNAKVWLDKRACFKPVTTQKQSLPFTVARKWWYFPVGSVD